MSVPIDLALPALVFLVAGLYASVGHGGASGYLALMSLFAFAPQQMASTALVLNVVVSGMAFWSFWKAGHPLPGFSWLIIGAAVPFSFLGGALPIKPDVYATLLAFALVLAAFRLIISSRNNESAALNTPPKTVVVLSGSGIGLMSGIVGVGGGIFLSPLAILGRWAPMKSVATVSALFILLNSVTGVLGRLVSGRLTFETSLLLLASAMTGGLVGARLGSQKFNLQVLRSILAIVLLIASTKLFWAASISK